MGHIYVAHFSVEKICDYFRKSVRFQRILRLFISRRILLPTSDMVYLRRKTITEGYYEQKIQMEKN